MLIGKNYPQQSNFSFSNGQKIGILLFGFFERIEETTICLRDRSLYSYLLKVTKGKIISKGLLVSSNSPKKGTNEFVFTTTTNSFVHFLGEFEDTKSPFEIIWPLPSFSDINDKTQSICSLADSGFYFRLLVSRWREVYSCWGIKKV